MKSALFAAALLIGTSALAQEYPDPNPADPVPPPDAMTTTPPLSPETPLMAPAQTPTVAATQTVAPGNSSPERDARGIAVISDPATAPAGFNQIPPAGTGGPLIPVQVDNPTQPATETYPPCTREVTDNCLQTYERGRSPDR